MELENKRRAGRAARMVNRAGAKATGGPPRAEMMAPQRECGPGEAALRRNTIPG